MHQNTLYPYNITDRTTGVRGRVKLLHDLSHAVDGDVLHVELARLPARLKATLRHAAEGQEYLLEPYLRGASSRQMNLNSRTLQLSGVFDAEAVFSVQPTN